MLMEAGRRSIADVAALQRIAREAVGGAEQIARRSVRSIAKRRLGRLVVIRMITAAAIDRRVERPVLIGEPVVHLVVVMVVHVLMIGRGRDGIAILIRHRFTIPDGTIVFYRIINLKNKKVKMSSISHDCQQPDGVKLNSIPRSALLWRQ